jgi:hypothetical protein
MLCNYHAELYTWDNEIKTNPCNFLHISCKNFCLQRTKIWRCELRYKLIYTKLDWLAWFSIASRSIVIHWLNIPYMLLSLLFLLFFVFSLVDFFFVPVYYRVYYDKWSQGLNFILAFVYSHVFTHLVLHIFNMNTRVCVEISFVNVIKKSLSQEFFKKLLKI